MSRILSIEEIPKTSQPFELECILYGCGESATWQPIIEDGPMIVKPCVCDEHVNLSADEILADLNSHKRPVYRCPRHGASPRECDCCRDAEDILREMNKEREDDE